MKERAADITSPRLAGQLLAVFGGQAMRTGLGFLAVIMTARLLSVEAFGLFSLFVAVATTGSELTGKFLDWGLVRYAAFHFRTDRERAVQYFQGAFLFRLLSGVAVLVVGLATAGWWARTVFHSPAYEIAIRYGCWGTVALSLGWYALAVLQAGERFVAYGVVNAVNGLAKVILVGVVFLVGSHQLETILVAFVTAMLLTFVAGLPYIPVTWLRPGRRGLARMREVLAYSKWIALSHLFAVLQVHQGVFFLGRFASAAEMGLYAAAWNFVFGLDLFVYAMVTVFLPKVSRFTSTTEFGPYLRRAIQVSLLIILALVPLFFLARPLVVVLYSQRYLEAVLFLRILLAASLLTLPVHGIGLLLLALDRPEQFAYAYGIVLLFTTVANLAVIPAHGALGAVVVYASAKVLYGGIILLAFRRCRQAAEPGVPLAREVAHGG